ncbi:MAG: hypothetical protein ACYTAF_13045 [Planctomycetota bacterium]
MRTIEAHGAECEQVGVTPDGRYIITVSLDETVKLWSDR